MITYREFQPTAFDPKGLGLEDRQDWLVGPVSHTRDSDILTECNWDATIRELSELEEREKPEEDYYEVHRFGHWGPGWFEIVLIRPDSPAVKVCEDIESALADYPVLDDEAYSEAEFEAHEDGNCEGYGSCYHCDAKPKVAWNFTDDAFCEHNPDDVCAECEETRRYMVGVLLTSNDIGPGESFAGSSWEYPSDGDPYCLAFVDCDADVASMIEAEGWRGEETG